MGTDLDGLAHGGTVRFVVPGMVDPTSLETWSMPAMTAPTTVYRPQLDPAIRASLARLPAGSAATFGSKTSGGDRLVGIGLLAQFAAGGRSSRRRARGAAGRHGDRVGGRAGAKILRRIFVPLSDANMVMLIDGDFPAFRSRCSPRSTFRPDSGTNPGWRPCWIARRILRRTVCKSSNWCEFFNPSRCAAARSWP